MLILKAKYIKDYIIEATFDNGSIKYYDFKDWLFSAINPMHYKFRKIENFKNVKAEYGMIIIGNDEMEFPDYQIQDLEIKEYKNSAPIDGRKRKASKIA